MSLKLGPGSSGLACGFDGPPKTDRPAGSPPHPIVVATARKLATIGWHMLQNNQPYWYALPRPTETKLARLPVGATGQRRKSGCPKGYKAASNSPDGRRTRTLKALSQLYQAEGLPPMQAPKPGEQRAMAAMGLAEFVSALGKQRVIQRTTNSHKKQ